MVRPQVGALLVLGAGMAIAIAGSVVVAIAPEQIGIRRGMLIVALILMAAGYLLAARAVSSWTRTVLRIVAVLQLAWLGWVIARPLIPDLDDWQYRLIAAALWWNGIALLAIAARAWWRPSTPWVSIAAGVAVLLEAVTWAPGLSPAFDAFVQELGAFEPWVRPTRELLTSVAIVLLVRATTSASSSIASDAGAPRDPEARGRSRAWRAQPPAPRERPPSDA